MGKLEWCNTAINITSDANFYKGCWFLNYATGRADIWWLCGNKKLRAKLPAEWKGTCAIAYLVMPFTVTINKNVDWINYLIIINKDP